MSLESKSASPEGLSLKVKALLWERGHEGLEIARKEILLEEIQSKPLQESMLYFISSWEDVVHPALLALSCEAVGGHPVTTKRIGSALALLAGGADVHDDIIDESILKYGKQTVLGKFGKDIAILTGDALIVKGLLVLQDACSELPVTQNKQILEAVKKAFFGISSAEEEESSLKKSHCITPEEYLNMIKTKSAVSEATAKIGAVVGGGSAQEILTLSDLGRSIGILMTLRDEYIDMYEANELQNRRRNEWLPLPILYALKNQNSRDLLMKILESEEITEKDTNRIVRVVFGSKEVRDLKKEIMSIIKQATKEIKSLRANRDTFGLIIKSAAEDL